MAVKIKLKRIGKVHAPQYRIVVADSRTARNGRAIEEIGVYQPLQEPSLIEVDSQRVQYWLGVGAQPTEAVAAILKVTGDWQKFTGEPGAEGTLKVAEAKADKKVAYEAAVKEASSEPKTPAPKKKDDAKEAVETAAQKVEDAVETVAEKVEEAVETVVDKVEDVVEAAVHAVTGKHEEAASDAPAGEDAPAEETSESKPE
ncbi:MAG TPA: 30S ribosomal protein S16 [Candidatus Nanopelagicales bacterium]|nr:30S ribosomal protein S16 [Candidatus Nanopelagicales bacterium]